MTTPLAYEPENFKAMLLAEIYRIWRDTADEDYIAARGAYKAELWGPFLWSGLQAVEKHLKTVLLLSGKSTKGFGHDLPRLLMAAQAAVPSLSQIEAVDIMFISHLSSHGQNRYLTRQRVKGEYDLYLLDRVTRRLRLYCHADAWIADGRSGPRIQQKLPRNRKDLWRSICAHSVPHGYLEKILARKGPPDQRKILVWRNAMYCSRPMRLLSVRTTKWGWTNSFTALNSQQMNWLKDRVQL